MLTRNCRRRDRAFPTIAQRWRHLSHVRLQTLLCRLAKRCFSWRRYVTGEAIDIPLFAPHFDLLAKVHNKADFAELATGLGADPPPTWRLVSREDLSRLSRPTEELVLKPAWSRFGSRVLIRPSRIAIEGLCPTAADPWVAQAYLPGEEISAYAVAVNGRLAAFQSYRPTYRVGHGAGVAFEPMDAPVARQFADGLVSRLNWTGQISFDFRRDERGELRVIECNPRTTSGVHYFGPVDGLDKSILEGRAVRASLTAPMTLPLAMLAYGLPYAIRHRGSRPMVARSGRHAGHFQLAR